jgi:hypothetical protein
MVIFKKISNDNNRRGFIMKKILNEINSKEKIYPEKKPKYETPQIHGVTCKTSMSGAGCPTHTVQWQQVSCKC